MLRQDAPRASQVFRLTPIKLVMALVAVSLSVSCSMLNSDKRAADESTLKTLDTDWSKAAGSKDLDKTVSYYADDAIVMPPNSPAATSKGPIKAIWKAMLTAPGFSGGWTVTKVEAAKSGDIAYVSGTYDFTQNDASGKPANDKGKYLEVWKKQTDGHWKCAVDIFNSDLPATPPAATKPKPIKRSR